MGEFAEISRKCRKHLKSGDLEGYIQDLKQMANVLNMEGLRIDELKVLMLTFCYELNCTRTVDPHIIEKMMEAAAVTGMAENEVEQLYLDTIRSDTVPHWILGTLGSLHTLKLCMYGRNVEVLEATLESVEEMQNIPYKAQKM